MAVPQGWNESSGKYVNSPYYLNGDQNTSLQLDHGSEHGKLYRGGCKWKSIYSIDADGGIQISNRFNTLFEGDDGGDANFAKVNQFVKKSTLDIAGDLGQDIKRKLRAATGISVSVKH